MPKSAPSDLQHTVPSVDPNAAEGLLASIHLGDRIKKLRLRRSMGLVELGKKTGLSASFLSQLETGRVVPTLRNLSRIALVFDKDLSYFFENGERRIFRIQRKADRVRIPIGVPTPNYIAESFGILVPEGGLRPCMAEFTPATAAHEPDPFTPERYPGIEMVYVTSGSLEVNRKGDIHHLEPRDVLYISGTTQRSYRCHGSQPAQALIISFDAESGDLRRKPLSRPIPAA